MESLPIAQEGKAQGLALSLPFLRSCRPRCREEQEPDPACRCLSAASCSCKAFHRHINRHINYHITALLLSLRCSLCSKSGHLGKNGDAGGSHSPAAQTDLVLHQGDFALGHLLPRHTQMALAAGEVGGLLLLLVAYFPPQLGHPCLKGLRPKTVAVLHSARFYPPGLAEVRQAGHA